jgi:DNA-binding IclR family transcriptional regulator
MVQDAAPDAAERLVGADRVLAVLTELGRRPEGATLEELAVAVNSPKPTVHRALAALRKASLATQTSRGQYALGDEFFRLAFSNYGARPETARIEPLLQHLAGEYRETAHYAVMEGHDVVYRAKVDPPQGAVKLTSTVGGRNPVYCTAVGKLLLSYNVHTKAELLEWLGDAELAARTDFTITDADAFLAELHVTRARGFGVDDQENELGINCLAVPVFSASSAKPIGAVSVSALRFRYPIEDLVASAPTLLASVEQATSAAG